MWMDAILFSMQAGTQESHAMRSHLLRGRLEMVTAMAIVIEYYVPEKFRKHSGKWIPPERRGRIIPFPTPERKSA
jgi:hypothetical protein